MRSSQLVCKLRKDRRFLLEPLALSDGEDDLVREGSLAERVLIHDRPVVENTLRKRLPASVRA